MNVFVIGGKQIGLFEHFKQQIDVSYVSNLYAVKDYTKIEDYVFNFSRKRVKTIHNNSVNLNPEDVIIIHSELLLQKDGNLLDYKGIELMKWLRIKLRLLNPILLLGFNSQTTILRKHPEHYILFAPSNYYLEIPIQEIDFLELSLKKIKNEKSLKNRYRSFVEPDFKAVDIGHSLANEFGLRLVEKITKEVLTHNYEIKTTDRFLFSKAEFLYNYDVQKENKLALKEAYNKLKSELYEVKWNDEIIRKAKKIAFVDDQGGDDTNPGWFYWLKNIFELNDNTFKGILPRVNGKHFFDLELTFKAVSSAFNDEKPDLIFLDMRLLGDREKRLPIHQISGSKLLQRIKEWDASIPVIMLSATDRLKSMAILQEFPYCVDGFWGKPRIEKGDLDLTDSLEKLFLIVKKCFLRNKSSIEKAISVSKYQLLGIESLNVLNQPYNFSVLKDTSYIFFDTNFFSEENPEKLKKNHKLFYSIIQYCNRDNSHESVIIINDVWSELFLNTIKPKGEINLKQASEYSLIKLLEYDRRGLIVNNLYRDEQYCKNSIVQPEILPVEGHGNHYRVVLKRTIHKNYTTSRRAADRKLKKLQNQLIDREEAGKPVKTLLHADDTFRLLIRKLVNSGRKVLFVAEDFNCRDEIVKELYSLPNIYRDYDYKYGLGSGFLPIYNQQSEIVCTLSRSDNLTKRFNIN